MDYDPDDLKFSTHADDVVEWLEEITNAIEVGAFEPDAWEVDFLESINEKLEVYLEDEDAEELPLTGPQLVSLKKICDKVT